MEGCTCIARSSDVCELIFSIVVEMIISQVKGEIDADDAELKESIGQVKILASNFKRFEAGSQRATN